MLLLHLIFARALITNNGGAYVARCVMTTNGLKHIADVRVGKVRGNSRTYPHLRLPSQYVELVGQKAGIYEMNGPEGDTAFFVPSTMLKLKV